MSTAINTQLIDSLAQVILSLSPEEQSLLSQKVQVLKNTVLPISKPDLNQFFQTLGTLEPDPNQPTLQEISQEVKAARQELWLQK
jgi:hypothetical protein